VYFKMRQNKTKKDRTLTIRAEPKLLEWLEGEAGRRDESVGAVVRRLVREALEKEVEGGGDRDSRQTTGGDGGVDGRGGEESMGESAGDTEEPCGDGEIGVGVSEDNPPRGGEEKKGRAERLPGCMKPKGGPVAGMTGIQPGPRERGDGFYGDEVVDYEGESQERRRR
jgi:hypothetical protein